MKVFCFLNGGMNFVFLRLWICVFVIWCVRRVESIIIISSSLMLRLDVCLGSIVSKSKRCVLVVCFIFEWWSVM